MFGVNSNLSSLMQAIKGNPQGIFDDMMKNNPQFAKFVNDNKGKTVEQIAQENHVDLNLIKHLMR